jgi:excisionase family DNA binding protein
MEKLLLKDSEACTAIGVSRTVLWDLLRRGELESVKIGRSRRIPADALKAYVERLRTEGQPNGPLLTDTGADSGSATW